MRYHRRLQRHHERTIIESGFSAGTVTRFCSRSRPTGTPFLLPSISFCRWYLPLHDSRQTRGEVITSDSFFREAHNSLSPPPSVSLAELDIDRDRTKGDAYHFIVYLPLNGTIYELDGLKKAPIRHDAYDGSNWVPKAREAIEKRIATYPAGSVSVSVFKDAVLAN